MHDYLFWCSWCLTMSEDGEPRFREPKAVYEERELVEKAIPPSTKHNNFWRVANFSVGYRSRFRSRRAP